MITNDTGSAAGEMTAGQAARPMTASQAVRLVYPADGASDPGDQSIPDASDIPPAAVPARGPQQLVAELYRDHGLGLIRLALLLVGDQATAEDVVQDVFLGFQRALPRLRDQEKTVAYLRVSVVNRCRSVQRTRHRARLRRVQHELPVWSAESAAMAAEDRRVVLAAVARLPVRSREILVLRYYLDLSQERIAAILGISRGTVSSTLCRALAVLGRELKEEL